MIEHNAKRRQQYWTARAYFSISNNTTGRNSLGNRDPQSRGRARQNPGGRQPEPQAPRALHGGTSRQLGWIPPKGGMTAFPWLVSGENARPFCQAATEHGILLAPGDCFDVPSHFRLGFAAAGNGFSKALDRFGAFVKSWSSKMVTA